MLSRGERHIRVITIRSAILFFIPLFPASLVAESFSKFGLLAFAAFGSSAVGAFLGFLFGIPRSSESDQSSRSPHANLHRGSSEQPKPIRDNTNLEQVSDWL